MVFFSQGVKTIREEARRTLCDIQIARITNIANWYFERVVFPGQRLVFEAVPEALVEIHTGMMASAILSDTIPCDRLCVDEDTDAQAKPVSTPLAEASVGQPT